jgi:hypothetical protein
MARRVAGYFSTPAVRVGGSGVTWLTAEPLRRCVASGRSNVLVTPGFFAETPKTGGPNLGAGVNCWFHGGLGLTVQLRRAYGANYREILVGLALRP